MDIYEVLKKKGIKIPNAPNKGGVYFKLKQFSDKLVYVSGCGPKVEGEKLVLGKVGKEVTYEEGKEAACNCITNILAVIHEEIGDLNKIKQFVKILAFVASDLEFYNQPQIIDAASNLLIEIFGEERGCGARSAIGTNVLPGNIPVEIEALIEIY